MKNIYKDGGYSESNPNWHGADAGWKADQITRALEINSIAYHSCIEVGCGTGLVLENLARLKPGKSYSGYDISPDAAAFWEHRAPGLSFHLANLLETDALVDLVLAIDVFEHVPDYMGFLEGLRKHGKHFVFHIPLEMHLMGLLRDKHVYAREMVGHLHYFSRATALATLADCGYNVISSTFTKLSQETTEGTSARTVAANVLRRIVQSFSPNLAQKLLGGYSLLVVCKLRNHGDQIERKN
jgi:cyclopropane fatty-acyl-phospholipid synthase-like methyltransferase